MRLTRTEFLTLAALVAQVALGIALFVAAPFFTVWSLNAVFGLGIPMKFSTWAAVLWLLFVLGWRGKGA